MCDIAAPIVMHVARDGLTYMSVPAFFKGRRRKQMKKIDTSPMSPETAAFSALQDLLELLPARGLTDAEWASVDGAYGQWCATLAPGDLDDPGAPGSARARVLAAVARHRVERDDEDEVRRRAFDRLRKALDAAPRPRHATERDWLPILSAYDVWKGCLRPKELQGFFAEQRALRAKVIQAFEASPQALVVDAFERHRGHFYNSVREARRAAGVAARPFHRARLRQAAAAAARDLDVDRVDHDYDRVRSCDELIDESDERVWKAPEAAA
jgi:hypothetical protein